MNSLPQIKMNLSLNRIVMLIIVLLAVSTIAFAQKPDEQEILKTLNYKKDVIFKTVDGKNVSMDIFYPKGESVKKKNPWMLYIHGGGWAGGSIYNIFNKPTMRTLQTLLNSGVVVATVDYRLARTPVTAYDAVVDCKDAARFLLKNAKQYKLDTDRYGVWGGSAGGHLSLVTALGNDDDFIGDPQLAGVSTNFKCVASYFPFTSCLNPDLRPASIFEDEKLFVRLLGAPLNEKLELAKLLSPTELLNEHSPSILLLHGDKDKTLPVINSLYMMDVARKKNADVQLLTVKNGGHSFQGADIFPSMDSINDYASSYILNHLNVVKGSSKSKKKNISSKNVRATSYINSDASQYHAQAGYPKFSWNTTPMYYHFGDIDSLLSPSDVKFIAERTDFVCIEKSHAFKLLGDAVLGTKHEVEAFHKEKPGIKVLFYFNSFVAWPFTRFNKDFTPEGIAKNNDLKKFLAIDSKTGKLMEKTNGPAFTYYFDVLNPEFSKWWVNSVVEGVKISGADGVFIDRMNVDGQSGYPKDREADVRKAKGEMMASLKEKLGPDKILVGNNAAANEDVFPHCDAFMFEHYNESVLTKENLLKEWDDMARVAKAGKISIFRFGAKGKGPTDITIGATKTEGMVKRSKQQLEFYQACYLIGAQPYSYFQWNWGWNLIDGNLVNYPELLKPLGAPKESFKRLEQNGWQFTREFEHASVWLDTEKREAKITWH